MRRYFPGLLNPYDELSPWLYADADEGVAWACDVWKLWVPLDAIPSPIVDEGLIRKTQLRKLADEVDGGADDATVVALLIATQAWGSGIAGQGGDRRGPWRAAGALGLPDYSPGASPDPRRIEAVRQAVRLSRVDTLLAWRALKRGPRKLARWDEPFFTKLMAVAGYELSPQPWPLILDNRVRLALRALQTRLAGYGQKDYLRFLSIAHGWAADWNVSPEQIEWALGKHAGGPASQSTLALPSPAPGGRARWTSLN